MPKSFTPNLVALFSGLVFGLGLILAGMADPGKVLAFLDLAGPWDPSLGLVMAGAIGVAIIPFRLAKQRQHSLLQQPMQLPTRRDIDLPLVLGSIAFGIGWGLAGICPGPALVLLGAGNIKGLVFFVAMLAGMAVYEKLRQ